MINHHISNYIANWLSKSWQSYYSNNFKKYLYDTYRFNVAIDVIFEGVYIAEVQIGEIESGQIGGIIENWWLVNSDGLLQVASPGGNLDAMLDSKNFYKFSLIKFYTDGKRVLIGERLGPNLICRKSGDIQFAEGIVTISNIKLLWTTSANV